MRLLGEWDRSDLEALLANQVQESLTLDYKDSRAISKENGFRNEISKDVSAFANSAGGQVIFGIREAGHLPSGIDDGVDPSLFTREWLEQLINSTIRPRLQGLVIRQIALDASKVAYAIEVPQARGLAPHQANDHKYYKRFNFQSVPMEDYEVRDALRRSTTPSLFLSYRPRIPKPVMAGLAQVTIGIDIGNRSSEPSLYRVISIIVDRRLSSSGLPRFDTTSRYVAAPDGSGQLECFIHRVAENVPAHMPIFREYVFHLTDITLDVGSVPAAFGYSIAGPGHLDERMGSIRFDGNSILLDGLVDEGRV
jgi:hypothetical protein